MSKHLHMPALAYFSKRRTALFLFLFATLCLCSALASAALDSQSKYYKQLSERLVSPGYACVKGEPCAALAIPTATAELSKKISPESIYIRGCAACHDTGISNAPKIGDYRDWKQRLAKGRETLYQNAVNGINAMPARGVCVNCSDEQVRSAVDYVLKKSYVIK